MTIGYSFTMLLVTTAIVVAIIHVSKNRHRIKRVILSRLINSLKALQRNQRVSGQSEGGSKPMALTPEEKSEAELAMLQKIIDDRKKLASDTDISHHLWSLYINHFRHTGPQSLDPYNEDGDWFGVTILQASSKNNQNKFEFELKGSRYTFIDDEENRHWSDNVKLFSLFLYDEAGHCLIEIPMKVKVDKFGRRYSILSNGPKAFRPGEWTDDFIKATLIHQSKRNKEIRAQKHQERLWEIEDLKERFGIPD